MKQLLLAAAITVGSIFTFSGAVMAQDNGGQISADNFNGEQLTKMILDQVNGIRWKAGCDSLIVNDVLTKASKSQADFYVDRKRASVEEGMAGDEVKHLGGTKKVEELAVEGTVSKGKTSFSYEDVVNDLMAKINKSKKYYAVITNPKYFYTGITCELDKDGKKVYVSEICGGLDALNNGTKDRKKLNAKYTLRKYGLYPYETKDCKACEKIAPDLEVLENHIYLKDNMIYLESDNLKKFKKFFRSAKDGLAIDVVQRAQYPCDGPNIVDNNLNSKGILLKPMYQQKLYAKNVYAKDKKATQYKAAIAKIPKGKLKKLGTNFELNLVYISNKTWCRTIVRKYLETGDQAAFVPLGIFPDTIYSGDLKHYTPKPENQTIEFTIPYQKGTAKYNPADVQGFLKDLHEPKYQINGVSIEAHSSVEGDSLVNDKLQKERAQSIIDAMQGMSQQKIDEKITTSGSWDMFRDSTKDNPAFADYAKDSKYEIEQNLKDPATLTKLEPILAKERFCKIDLNVTYDITGANEQQFVISQFKKAIAQKNAALALTIQKYIIRQILVGKYDPNQLVAVAVPNTAPFASVTVNDIFIDDKYNQQDTISQAIQSKFDDMDKTMSSNDYVHFNKVLCQVKLTDIGDEKSINDLQSKINALYSTKAPQSICDNLNLEYQFKIMEKLDTLPEGTPNPPVDQALDRVKKIFNISGSNWQDALKLAYIFNKHNDLSFSMKLLAPFVSDPNINEQLLFTYISVAAHFPDQVFSRTFRLAMSNAATKNQSRYCDLFGNPYLSFQLMDNPLIKDTYCKTCSTGEPEETPKKSKIPIKINIEKPGGGN